MSLVFKQKKNYTEVTSSCFEDIKLIKQSMSENHSERWTNRKEYPNFDFGALALANTVQMLKLAKEGANEISSFADALKPGQLDKYKLNYGPLVDFVEDDSEVKS